MTKGRKSFSMIAVFMIAAALMAICPGALAAEESGLSEPVMLFVATDLHYISPELTDHGEFFQRMIENGDREKTEQMSEGQHRS